METHSSSLAWKIPREQEPGGLQSTGPQGVSQTDSWLAGAEGAAEESDLTNSVSLGREENERAVMFTQLFDSRRTHKRYTWKVWILWDVNSVSINLLWKVSEQGHRQILRSMHGCMLLLKSCPTLCNPVDQSPPGSSVHGILQARILAWVAMPSSRGSSRPRDRTRVSSVSRTGRWVLHLKRHLGI